MLFNSLAFGIFLPIVFLLYWFVVNRNHKVQNLFIVLVSCIFYGWWDWRFLILVFISATTDYMVGLALVKQKDTTKRKLLLWISVGVNLGILGFFKYFNFFLENFVNVLGQFGLQANVGSLRIMLPVGISFYTFQALSYSIDVYKRKIKPTKNYVAYLAFIVFFPHLVAGPIMKAINLLPQFYTKRIFDYSKAVDGLRQILWGLFKKIVIADNCASLVNGIFPHYLDYPGSVLLLGAFFFAFQIYGDFSGYSDIAIGTAKLLGFNLMQNFAFPYFSRDIAEFWRRWHISLTSWFRDYVYIPLGGSQGNGVRIIRNVMVVFLVSGFWHGANWTFIAWGLINAMYFIPLLLFGKNRQNLDVVAQGKVLPSLREIGQMAVTFCLALIAWVFFRSDNIGQAVGYIKKMLSPSLLSIPGLQQFPDSYLVLLLIGIFIAIEWSGREQSYAIQATGLGKPRLLRWSFYYLLVMAIALLAGQNQQFLYFQF